MAVAGPIGRETHCLEVPGDSVSGQEGRALFENQISSVSGFVWAPLLPVALSGGPVEKL